MTAEMRALCMGVLGCAAAALVAQGLGTDHGDYDLAAVEQLVDAHS